MKELLEKLLNRENLSFLEAELVITKMINAHLSPEEMGALLIALRMKGENADEIAGFAHILREKAIKLPVKRNDLIDTCGTGGTGKSKFNISTTVAFVLAAAGIGVPKHGNRAVSGKCGSADVLEHLGINLNLTTEQAAQMLEQTGFTFLFAPNYHPSFKNIMPVRKKLGVRTIFNILGPLVSPALVKRQVLGVFTPDLLKTMALTLKELGTEEAMVINSEDGLDEFSISAPTHVCHLKNGDIKTYKVTPEEAGLKSYDFMEIKGGDVTENVRIIENILAGEKGAKRDIVLLNAAAALLVAGKVSELREGVAYAAEIIDNGKVQAKLKEIRSFDYAQ